MKTLLVHYTPTRELSRSKVLLDVFRAEIANSDVEELDLCTDLPDLSSWVGRAAPVTRGD
jgi:hypothetical protein